MKQLKLITKLRGLIVLALALVFSGNAWATDATLTVADGTATSGNIDAVVSYNAPSGSVGTSGYGRTYYLKTSKNGTVTFSCTSGYVITNIVLTTYSGDAQYLSANVGSYSTTSTTGTWTGSSNSITFTDNNNNSYISNVVVTYETATTDAFSLSAKTKYVSVGKTTSFTINKADGFKGIVEKISETSNPETEGATVATYTYDETSGTYTFTGVSDGSMVLAFRASGDQTDYNMNTASITIIVTTGHTPSNHSTSWTTSNEIYLYNKATGLYLGSGGHWGTEGILKTTGLPFYMDAAASEKSDATGVGMFSDSGKTTAHKVGYQSSAQVFGIENQGIYIDAGTNYPGQTFSFYYNSDDESYSIVPDAMVTGIEISGTNDEGKTVYLTPSSKSTLSWTTTPYYWSMNSSNQIYTVDGTTASSLGTKYYLYTNGSTISMSTSGSTCSIDNNGYFTIGSTYYLTGNSTDVTSSSSTSSATATKYEQGTTSKFYLTKNGGTSVARQNVVTVRQYSTTDIPDEARWFVVTKADLIADFENATASEASPKEATFLLTNPDFSREVTQGWTFQQPTGSSYTSQTSSWDTTNGYIRIGNSLFQNSGPNHTINDQYTSVEEAGVALGSGTYKGNGNGYTLDATDAEYANLPEGTSTYYNIPYGGFYNCRILGNSGKVYQQVTITKAGYYRVSCDGYVYNPSGATGSATFYAKNTAVSEVGKQYVTTALPTNATFETMTAAGITFYANGGTSAYHNSILVYIPIEEGKTSATMEIGVYLAGGTIGTVKNSNTNTFAEFDAMKIEYTGDPEFDIILDENRDNTLLYTSGPHYINAQVYNVTGKKARTMYLKRTMTEGKWNSLVLPVNVSNSAFNTAFGTSAKLTKFQKCEGNIIYFELVDHSDEDSDIPAMEAGTCYLVKPASISAAKSGTYTTKYAAFASDETRKDMEISVTACTEDIKYQDGDEDIPTGKKAGDVKIPAGPVFQFNQVTLASNIPDLDHSDEFMPSTDASAIPTNLAFMGTYFYNPLAVGYGSYIINTKNNNVWNRYMGTTAVASKGFRCWIGQEAGNVLPSGSSKLIMVVDDEEIEPTDIAGVAVKEPTLNDNRVYSVSGQLVGTSENTNKLPKGIYISNGKKFIVK